MRLALALAIVVLGTGASDAGKPKRKRAKAAKAKPAKKAPAPAAAEPAETPDPPADDTTPAPAPVSAPAQPEPARDSAARTPSPPASKTRSAPSDRGATVASTHEVHATAGAAPRASKPWLSIGVDGRPFWRRLRYNDDYKDILREYDLAANAVGVTVVARPAGGLHVIASGELAVGVNGSRTISGMMFSTSASEWSAGLRYDLHLGSSRAAIGAGYGEQRFSIADEEMAMEYVPDVTYRYLRGGLELEQPFGRWSLLARGAWRHLLATGELADARWFPRSTGAGIDAAIGATVHLGPVAAYARAELRHYFFAMNPEVGDPLIAGGAIDSYLGAAIGLGVNFR